jgi:hypothetical protein
MTDDINAISGEHEAYVPCDEVPVAVTASAQDSNAVYGDEEGFVAANNAASAESADETDTSAVFGKRAGYVPGPCVECTSLSTGMTWNDMDVGGGTAWYGTRTNQTGAGSFVQQFAGSQGTGSGWASQFPPPTLHQEGESRGYASIDISAYPTATHATLHATLRNWIAFIEQSYIIGNEAVVDWELVAGSWGTGTPVWDDGIVAATGSIPASTAFFDADGILVVPIETITIDATFPVTYPYAQWYFRVVSTYGYRHPSVSAALFTNSVIDLRWPNDTFVDPHSPVWWEALRSHVSLMPLVASPFEDWTLDILSCS